MFLKARQLPLRWRSGQRLLPGTSIQMFEDLSDDARVFNTGNDLTLLKDEGMPVEERLVDIDEVIDGMHSGQLEEIFGAGTAAAISPVGAIAYKGKRHEMRASGAGPLTRKLYDTITGIHLGEGKDKFGWTRVVDVKGPASAAAAGD